MSPTLPSATLSKLRQEISIYDSKDRLLSFGAKGDFQSPLIMDSGDKFLERWLQSKEPLPLETFFPVGASYTLQQKLSQLDSFMTVLREKKEDFGESDLYLVLGFLKWDGNALAPSILIPLDVDINKKTLSLSKRTPIENVVLRERLKDVLPSPLPKADDAIINDQFSIQLYFSLFEKAIANARNWKFTRHGVCLGFFNTGRLLLRKWFDQNSLERKADGNSMLSALLTEEGFETQESLFDDADFNQIFSPADHHFLYITDSHTSKVTLDALNENAKHYAIQALPGTSKIKVASNIVSESIACGNKILVVHRRATTASSFEKSWKPPFRTFKGLDRNKLQQQVQEARQSISSYYDTVNKPIMPAGITLSELVNEFSRAKAPKHKFPEATFQGLSQLNYKDYQALKQDLQDLIELYFEKNGCNVRKAFQSVNVSSLTDEQKTELAKELAIAAEKIEELSPLVSCIESAGLFPQGILLSNISDTLKLLQEHFDQDTPSFEQWDLRSNNWESYKETLQALPAAGDKWVNFRRQTSEIYTDNAADENILSAREIFAESQKTTLKGLTDRYRSSRKKLLKVIRNPKSIESDAQLLELIDALLDLQENKRAYKESSVLCNRLLGKDWGYERSNWEELGKKIQYLYDFRKKYVGNAKADQLLQVLEQWHLFKELYGDFEKFQKTIAEFQVIIRQISKDMELEKPLEHLNVVTWLDTIKAWSANWDNLDTHLQLTTLFNRIETYNCQGIVQYIQDTDKVSKDIVQAITHHWTGNQIQHLSKVCPDVFSLSPKSRNKKNKEYKALLDTFCNANFQELHEAIENDSGLLESVHLNETMDLAGKHFQVAIILDADSISVVEAMPTLFAADKVILIGDPHNPSLERQPFDAYQETPLNHTALFHDSILAAALRQGIPTRELWFSTQFSDPSLVEFANKNIYNNGIKQLPSPNRNEFKGLHFKAVPSRVLAISQAAIRHAEKNPGKTLGIIAFHQYTCHEIESTIKAMLVMDSAAGRFFSQQNLDIRYYVKTPERAVDRPRDVIFVCAESDGTAGIAGERKVSICSTLAKSEIFVFVSQSDLSKQVNTKQSLFWNWIAYLQNKSFGNENHTAMGSSEIRSQIIETLQAESIQVEESFSPGGIAVGPVVVDANNPKRFLALIEEDCSTERFRNTVEDRCYIRPSLLGQLGWKVMYMWLPFWLMARQDEIGHLVATLAIEQSVAPPPPSPQESENDEDSEIFEDHVSVNVVPYQMQHPKIEGTPHDKPIAELPVAALITQLKFYVDHEAPIHQDVLKNRLLELHHVDRAGPMIMQALTEAINQGLQKKCFVKTGPFFYTLKPQELSPRDRTGRPDSERKLAYVSPEERSLLPSSMDEHTLKQTLGLLE